MTYIYLLLTCIYACIAQHVVSQNCIFIQIGGVSYSEDLDCNRSKICRTNFTIKSLSMPPYSSMNIIENIIRLCCKRCLKGIYKHEPIPPFSNKSMTESLADMRRDVHMGYPFLASADASTLYGWHFVPFVPVSSFFYVTRKEGNVLLNVMISSLQLYPLVIICLTLAIISGFVIWLLETWDNEAEFSRPFLIGWSEGCWWSFISMTTVGYGDKTPRKVLARIFSIIWILIGVALFALATAEITSILVDANNPPVPTVQGKVVGVLKYRECDKSYVTKKGGILYFAKDRNKREHFRADIHQLIWSLRNKKIDGIIFDKITMAYILEDFRAGGDKLDKEERENAHFILHKTLRTEDLYPGDKMAYGIIMKHKEHYDFFGSAIIDNRLALMSNNELAWNQRVTTVESKENLFNPKAIHFLTGIKAIACIIGFIIAFGIIFELSRRKCDTCYTSNSNELQKVYTMESVMEVTTPAANRN